MSEPDEQPQDATTEVVWVEAYRSHDDGSRDESRRCYAPIAVPSEYTIDIPNPPILSLPHFLNSGGLWLNR